MNEIISKFLLAGDKFRLEMHLRKPEYMYSACHQTKNKQRKKTLRNKKLKICLSSGAIQSLPSI